MNPTQVAELLSELEVSPEETDILDIERLLVLTDHERCHDESGLMVYIHREWRTYWNFDPTRREVPAGYVLAIVRTLRARMAQQRRRG